MKKIVLGTLAVAVFVAGVGVGGHRGYAWKKSADQRGYLSEQSATYLFAPTELTNEKGEKLRRVDLMDMIILQAVKNGKR